MTLTTLAGHPLPGPGGRKTQPRPTSHSDTTATAAAPTWRPLVDGSAGQKLRHDLASAAAVFVFGASTPLRNAFLYETGHRYSWLSSFEVATQLCEKDDESIGFEEIAFFLRRVAKHTPEMGVLVDCDTGWATDAGRQSELFAELDGMCAAFVLANLRPGMKVNSFKRFADGSLMPSTEVAGTLLRLASGCTQSLVVLRLENLNVGATPASMIEYIDTVLDCGGWPDGLLVHDTNPDVSNVEKFGELVRERFGEGVYLASVTTAYGARAPAVRRLRAAGYQILIVPNFALRAEFQHLRAVYSRLATHDFDAIEAEVPPMRSVLDYIEARRWSTPSSA